jgi:O-antigen/teichoic acid export membrane protein
MSFYLSAEAVAYFSTPYDVIISILLIPGIFVSVLFPVFSERFAADREAVQAAYRTALYQNLLLILPVCTIAFIFAKPLMTLWLGAEFAGHSYRVAQWLALGVFVNSFGYYAQALLQAIGRPDITAKLHVAELAAYLPYMMWLVHSYGVEGAAISWTIRVCISTIALTWLARQCLDGRIHTRHDGKQYDNI